MFYQFFFLLQCNSQRPALHQLHNHAVPVEVDGPRHREAAVPQRGHVGELLGRRDARQVQPGGAVAVRMVVAFLFDVAETSAAESGVKGEDDYEAEGPGLVPGPVFLYFFSWAN